jgi:hypothetical protein
MPGILLDVCLVEGAVSAVLHLGRQGVDSQKALPLRPPRGIDQVALETIDGQSHVLMSESQTRLPYKFPSSSNNFGYHFELKVQVSSEHVTRLHELVKLWKVTPSVIQHVATQTQHVPLAYPHLYIYRLKLSSFIFALVWLALAVRERKELRHATVLARLKVTVLPAAATRCCQRNKERCSPSQKF